MMRDDPQDVAESLDEDVVLGDDVGDRTGDEYGEGLPDYLRDRPLGEERVEPGTEPARRRDEDGWRVGQLIEPHASTEDDEAELVADEAPGAHPSAEEAAMHLERER